MLTLPLVLSPVLNQKVKLYSGPIRGRITDTDGSTETPHPSLGGPTPPSVIRHTYRMGLYQEKNKKNTHLYGWYKCLEIPHPSTGPDGIGKWAYVYVDGQVAPTTQKLIGPLLKVVPDGCGDEYRE